MSSRLRPGCASTCVTTYRLPGTPPRGPASPSPERRIWCPSSMPAGIVTRRVRCRSTRPSPRQVGQGFSTIWPWPRQRPQVVTLTIWPSIVERTWRTSPLPLHWGQVVGLRAGLRAAALARLAASQRGERDLLLGAADGLVERQPQVVAQVGAGGRPAASRAGLPPSPPKNASKMSPKPREAAERAVALARPCRRPRPARTCRRPGAAGDRRGPGRPR